MARYKYLPMTKSQYMEKYINTLKTGEILVDLRDHDVYVTEDGYNIPIPSTKGIRDQVINFLENDVEGIKLKKRLIPSIVSEVSKKANDIERLQGIISNDTDILESRLLNQRNTARFLSVVNENNVNQLGDLEMNTNRLREIVDDNRLEVLLEEFNRINNDARDIITADTTRYNRELMEIYRDMYRLMNEANGKLNKLGRFLGDVQFKRVESTTGNAFDVTYSRRDNTICLPNLRYVNGPAKAVWLSQVMQSGYIGWFTTGRGLNDGNRITRNDMLESGNERGTGLFYKNFPNKRDMNTGSLNGVDYHEWTIFEAAPLSDANICARSGAWSIDWMYSRSNTRYPGYWRYGGYYTNTSDADFASVVQNPSPSERRSGYALAGLPGVAWRGPWVDYTSGTLSTPSWALDIVSTVSGNQRIAKSTRSNSYRGCVSNHLPSIPYMKGPYIISSSGGTNYDGCLMRLGLAKTLTTTKIAVGSTSFNSEGGWS